MMKQILSFCIFLVCVCSIAKQVDKKIVQNGLEISNLTPSQVLPYSKDLFGSRIYFPLNTTCFQNIIDKNEDGTFIVVCNTEIICIANKKKGSFDGNLSIYPDGIFSVHATLNKGILEGKCTMIFQPFKYSFNSKMSSVSNYDYKRIPVPKEKWISKGEQDFSIKTEGFFKNGKKFTGTFLQIEPQMDLRIVRIQRYSNFKLVSVSSPRVFKISPWMSTL